ncbi:MAG: hypothetical protein IK077_11750 [Thermoguttaceae bacterium]|nr:hypothetical protein [Thermoguttaceae bacterium]
MASHNLLDRLGNLFNTLTNVGKTQTSRSGRTAYPRKNHASPKRSVLRLEALENRELLSVEPMGAAPFETADIALVATASEQTPIAVLSEQDMQELVSSGVLEDSVAEKIASTQWNAGKRWFYYDDGLWDGYFKEEEVLIDGKPQNEKVLVCYNWFYDEDGEFVLNEEGYEDYQKKGPLLQLIDDAADAGCNGMVWKCYVDDLADPNNPETEIRTLFLKAVKNYANERNIEIIPTIWLVGGNAFLSQDPNLVEGLLQEKIPMKVGGGEDGESGFVRTVDDMESLDVRDYNPDHPIDPAYWTKTDALNFTESNPGYNGGKSLLVTLPGDKSDGVQRSIEDLPDGYYYVTCKVKIQTATEPDYHAAEVIVYNPDDLSQYAYVDYKRSGDNYVEDGWVEIRSDTFRVSAGVVGVQLSGSGVAGEMYWFDDLKIHAANHDVYDFLPIQRDGTPIRVYKKAESGEYVEIEQTSGEVVNWKLPDDYKLKYEYGPDFYVDKIGDENNPTYVKSVNLEFPEGSQILEENIQTIYVDYYKPKPNRWGDQKAYSVCLSEEKLYKLMEDSALVIQQTLQPKTWFIAFDEVTVGATCETCAGSHLTTAQIFGKSVARQYDIIRNTEGVDPNAEIVVWSDMFYTKHNALERYENVNGSLVDAVNYIPNDLIIACWYDDKDKSKNKSVSEAVDIVSADVKEYLNFFSKRGFRTMAASYYDWEEAVSDMPADKTDANTQGWLDAIADSNGTINNNVGMIYTTWDNRNYAYLDPFGSALQQVEDDATPIASISLNTTLPLVGTALTATLSPDADAQTAATYQWYRKEYDDGIKMTIWKAIANATSPSYTPTADDVGKELKVAAVGIGNYAGTVFAKTSPVRSEDSGVADIAVSNAGKISSVAIVPNGAWSVDGIVLTNVGESESDDVALSFYATVSGTIDEQAILLKTIDCGRLAASAAATVSSGTLLTSGLTLGQAYRIAWKAECSNDSATANNVGLATKSVTVCPEAENVDVVDFDRESYAPRQGDAFWLETWLNSGATGPNKHAFWFDFGDGTYVERANSGVVMPGDYPNAAGNTTISVKVVDLTIKKIVAKGTASLNIVQATPAFYIEPESALNGDALILSVEAFLPVPTAISKWTFDWGYGEKTVLEHLSLKANASHYYAPSQKLRVVTLSVTLDDVDFSVTFDAETLPH